MLFPALLCALCAAEPDDGKSWTSFRDGGVGAIVANDLPLRWSPKENVAWRRSLPGYGQSSPVVWNGRAFATSVEGERKETCWIVAVDVASGEIVWRRRLDAAQTGANNPSVSRAAPTPVVDEQGLYVFFESGDLLGLSHDGEVRWRRSLASDYGPFKNHHGLGSSPAETEEAIVVLIEHSGPSYLLAVSKATGETLWKVERPSALSWASPIVVKRDGREIVLVSSAGTLAAYAADSGERLWNLDGLSGNLIPSATVDGDRIFVGAGEGGLSFDVAAAAKSNCVVRMTSDDGKPGYEALWRGERAVAHHASPLLHDGFAYLLTKVGILHCFDARTGEERYAERVVPCWATPIAIDDRIYLFGKDGQTIVVKAGPTFEILAESRLWSDEDRRRRKEASRAAPENEFPPLPEQGRRQMEAMLDDAVGDVVYAAVAIDGTLLVRTGTELFCIREAGVGGR